MTAPGAGAERLRALLPDAVPLTVAELPDDDQAALARLIERAFSGQESALTAAFENAVRSVPLPARRLVRKALFG